MSNNRDLGDLGESQFANWCHQIGIKPNGSKIDKTGWDFIIEFPFDNLLGQKDIHVGATECKIQIKSTDNITKNVSIKLDNLKRLANSPQPSFIIILEYEGKSIPVRAYVIHIDEINIKNILQKCYPLDQNKLHKEKMNFSYRNSYQMQSLDGEGLKQTILKFVNGNLNDYVAKKNKFLSTVGWESDALGEIKLDLIGLENINKLIDVSLGLSNEVEVKNVIGVYSRFNIPELKPFINQSTAKLQLPQIKPSSFGKVFFKENILTQGIPAPAKLYISCLHNHVDEKFRKIRIDGNFFQLILTNNNCQLSLSLPLTLRMDINELINMINIFHLLKNIKNKIYLEYKSEDTNLSLGSLESSNQNYNSEDYIQLLGDVLYITNYLHLTELQLSLKEVNDKWEQINQMAGLLKAQPKDLKLSFNKILNESSILHDPNIKSIYLYLCSLKVGNYYIAVIIGFWGEISEFNNQNIFIVERIEKITSICIKEIDFSDHSKTEIENEFNSIVKQYSQFNNVITSGD